MARTLLTALALTLTLGVAGNAVAADKLSGTEWKHTDTRAGEEMTLAFAPNGVATFTVKDAKGTTTTKALYSIDGDTLRLKVIGRDADGKIKVELIDITLVSLDAQRLVTRLGTREREFSKVR
jgi:hypothetical protein